jgi:hypothetical protein
MLRWVLILLLSTQALASHVDIQTAALPNGTAGQSYSAAIYATGGCLPYIWKVYSGSLPPGILASNTSGNYDYLKGIPTTAGTYQFSISAQACWHYTSRKTYIVTIAPPLSHKVTLAWQASTTPGVSYNVLRSTISGGYYQQIATVTATGYSDTQVTSGKTYYYTVVSVLNQVTSPYSNQVTAVIP